MKKRIISIFLALSLIIPPMAAPASAAIALPGGVAAGATSIVVAPSLVFRVASVVEVCAEMLGISGELAQAVLDYLVSVTGYGNLGYDGLQSACNRLNQIAAHPTKYAELMYQDFSAAVAEGSIEAPDFTLFYKLLNYFVTYYNDLVDGWHIIEHPEYGYVIANQSETFILADSVGRYPYAQEITDKWLGSRTALAASTVNLATDYSLKNLQSVHEVLHPDWSFRRITVTLYDGQYSVLQAASDGVHYDQILCDALGFPYGIPIGSTQMGGDRDYNNDKDGQPEVSEDPIVDIDGDLVMQMFPDGSFTWITNRLYDAENKTYYLDCSTTYEDNDTYYSYTWNYTYHIDYTSITYIGQAEEYNKHYEYYYDLPDGRSSADLTADELLALNTQVDVVPYIRSADDTSIRALYHFDGDTRDSSFWNYKGDMEWVRGASITYMDAGPFNGALYLDETEHQYNIKLPSLIGTQDFTLQFRLYQSHTLTPQTDSSITSNGTTLIQFDGSYIRDSSGNALAPLSIGNWQEICLVRRSGVLRYFHNGVQIGQVNNATVLGSEFTFTWGSAQQTYKYFDELRVLNKALYTASFGDVDSYTPTAVPFDTNLSLVLPDSYVPVADEYWSITSTRDNIFDQYGLSSVEGIVNSSYFVQDSDLSLYQKFGQTFNFEYDTVKAYPRFTMLPTFTSFSTDSEVGTFTLAQNSVSSCPNPTPSNYTSVNYNYDYLTFTGSNHTAYGPTSGLFSPVSTVKTSGGSLNTSYYLPQGTYTLSLVFDDGVTSSVTFNNTASYASQSVGWVSSVTSHGYQFGLYRGWSGYPSGTAHSQYYLRIMPTSTTPGSNILYMELCKDSSTDLTAEFVTAVAPVDSDFQTPTLAVRTDLEITGYQIGGVRLSLPEKGLVWALVEGGRITSLQIYNGQAWEEVDGRIWTGSRWVPYYAYDVLLLKDLYDIVESDPTLNPIYTESGFWSWLQGAWGEMMAKLDQIIAALGGSPTVSDCPHVYQSEVDREPGCVEPGYQTYTCDLCGHKYTELIDAHGHDWIVTGSIPDVLDDDGAVIEEGYDELTCSVCGTEGRDYGEGPEENDLFDALGDFIADGITWILEKLEELADSMRQITEIFNGFVERVKSLGGGFPLFFGAFMALIPEDLATVLWFAVVAFVVLFVWKRWSE